MQEEYRQSLGMYLTSHIETCRDRLTTPFAASFQEEMRRLHWRADILQRDLHERAELAIGYIAPPGGMEPTYHY